MSSSPIVTFLVVAALLAVVVSLGVALVGLVRDKGQGTRMVKALTFRIALSIVVFALLMLGIFAGIVVPHGVAP